MSITSWKFIKLKLFEIDDFEVLVSCGSSHFSHNISTSISDCANLKQKLYQLPVVDKNFRVSISRAARNDENTRRLWYDKAGRCLCLKPIYHPLIFEAALKNIDLPYENLAEAYIKSRITKWSKSSVEQKYKVPAPWLSY